MAIKLPLIMYDINNQQIQNNFLSTKHTFFLRSYMDFDIRVLSGDCVIYRVITDKITGEPITTKSDVFLGDESTTSYTLFMKSDCVLQCGYAVYKCHLQVDNVFAEELDDLENNDYPTAHYNELLVNYFLPTWEELEPVIFGNNKREIIKRMLIDFRKILIKKGTLKSIELFFKFVNLSGIKIYAEFAHQNKDNTISKTINPDKTTDWKTGDYHLLFDNWKQETGNDGLNSKNLPIRKIHVENMDEFFEKLMYAIALADKYFTLPEQEISFFGVTFSSNIMRFPNMTNNVSQIEFDDIHYFRKSVTIDMYNFSTSTDISKLIDNNIQLTTDSYLSEVKVVAIDDKPITETLTLISDEIFDDEIFDDEIFDDEIFDDEIIDGESPIEKYNSIFGNVLHLDIESPNTYIDLLISSKYQPEKFIHIDKYYAEQPLKIIFLTTQAGEFNIEVTIWDGHNNREKYNYKYYIDENLMVIDFETFNSVIVTDDISNDITLDVSSANTTQNVTDFLNYTLFQKNVPDDLSEYYSREQQKYEVKNFINTNKIYLLPDINKNFAMGDVTETLPLGLSESWIDIYTFRYDESRELMLQIYDGNICEYISIPYTDISKHLSSITDKLFITVMDITIYEGVTTKQVPYIFITTTEMGIDIRSLFNFELVYENYTETLYDNTGIELSYRRLPVNYDYELFIRPSILVPDFKHYISGKKNHEDKIILKSLFPRLINISLTNKQTYSVNLGDVICCRTNKDYVITETDILWEVINAFTGEVIFRINDEMLKFRVEDKTIYSLVVTYKIKGATHRITKESMFSSFSTI